jgi:hypothetical protein
MHGPSRGLSVHLVEDSTASVLTHVAEGIVASFFSLQDQRRQAGSCASASSTVSSLAAVISWADPFGKGDLGGSVGARGSVFLVDGSQAFLGKAVRDTNESWPEAAVDERDLSVDQPRCDTSGELRTRLSTAKISWPDACPHQLPRMGSPATYSARLGTGPRADCKTMPCSRTHSSGSTIIDSTTRIARFIRHWTTAEEAVRPASRLPPLGTVCPVRCAEHV